MKASEKLVEAIKEEIMQEIVQTALPNLLKKYIPQIVQNITFDVKEAAEYIGASPDTVRALYREGKIPHYRVRGHVRFRKVALDKWIEEQEQRNCFMENQRGA